MSDGSWRVVPVTLKLGLGTTCLRLALLPDPQLSLSHLRLPGLCTSRETFLLGLSTSTQGCGSFRVHSQGLAWCAVYSRYHKVLIESRK